MLFLAANHLPTQTHTIAELTGRVPSSRPMGFLVDPVVRVVHIHHLSRMLRCADAEKCTEGSYIRYTSAAIATRDIATYLPN